MLTTLRLAVLSLLLGGVVAVGTLPASAADDCGRGGDCGGSATTSGNTVIITVTGTLVRGGSPGSSASATVSVPTPCYLMSTSSGKELAEQIERTDGMVLGPDRQLVPADDYWPGWKDHADDEDGHWYVPVCEYSADDPPSDQFMEDFFARTDPTYVEAGEAPPTPPIPPEVLLAAAQEALEVPDPRFEMNPRRGGAAVTVVNLPTWFWARDPTDAGSVTASAGGNTVTVDLRRESVVFSSASAGAVTCADGGTAWTPGGSSDCTLTFRRSATAQTVNATTRWVGTWSFNGVEQGAVDPVTATWSDAIGVGEIQSIVTKVG